MTVVISRAALLVTALWKKKILPSSLLPTSRGFFSEYDGKVYSYKIGVI